jgi:hypothetical protein
MLNPCQVSFRNSLRQPELNPATLLLPNGDVIATLYIEDMNQLTRKEDTVGTKSHPFHANRFATPEVINETQLAIIAEALAEDIAVEEFYLGEDN